MSNLVVEKRVLRATLKATLAALSSSQKTAGGAAIARHLSPLLPASGVVAFFASTLDELDTRPLDALLIARGIARAVPRIVDGDLRFHLVAGPVHDLPRDRFGIPTPSASNEEVSVGDVAFVVVPGLGFDVDGGRVGYGRGYYDRALAGVDRDRGCGRPRPHVVGVFLDEQRVERVPMEPTDVRLPRLCTPSLGVVDVDKSPLSL